MRKRHRAGGETTAPLIARPGSLRRFYIITPQAIEFANVKPPVSQANAETTLEGNVEVITEDSDQGSRTLYFLIVGDRRVPLRFTARPLNLTTGTRIRVRGRWERDDTLVVTAIERL